MLQEQILTILYDMALAIGSEDRVHNLVLNVLKRLIHHTGYPVGLFLLNETDSSNESRNKNGMPLRLEAGIGDYMLKQHTGTLLSLPAALTTPEANQFNPSPELLETLPIRKNHYQCALRLPIPEQGMILLLSPARMSQDIPFAVIFQPVMANLAKSLQLCRNNEKYTTGLIHDRDEARSAHQRFRAAMDTSNDCVFIIDPEKMRFIDFNVTAAQVLGYERFELLQLGPQDIKPEYTRERLERYFRALINTEETEHAEIITLHQTRTGRAFPVEIRFSVLHQSPPLIIAIARDITERKEYEERLFEEKERALTTLHSIGDGVITTDPEGLVQFMNPIAEDLTGWDIEDARGLPLSTVFRIINEYTREPTQNPVSQCLRENRIIALSNHTILINRDGEEIAIEDSAAPIRNRNSEIIGVVLVFHDVTKARKLANELSWNASHDPLTKLVNRREFERRLGEAHELSIIEGQRHTLLYIDLDQFKIVNDTCGHAAGDQMLNQLAVYLKHFIRRDDTLARLGGDEFGVLLSNCDLTSAQPIAEKIRSGIDEFRFVWDDKGFKTGASIGMVEISTFSGDLGQILSNADVACYAAKDNGGNRVHVYEPNDNDVSRRKSEMQWVSHINEALENNRLTLYTQVIRATSASESQQTIHEILLRMYDMDDNLITPATFIPAAERYRLMPAIDRWVIKHALRLAETHHANLGQAKFTINLSGASLAQDGLYEYIQEQFAETGARPEHFCFEVTETAAIANIGMAYNFIRAVKKLGCSFALDDFGSGLSSFTYLKHLPVDYLKIDGSFVKDILSDPIDASMVSAINRMGHDLGLKTIAEFVEDHAIFEKLREIGVDYGQGFALGRPLPIEELYSEAESR